MEGEHGAQRSSRLNKSPCHALLRPTHFAWNLFLCFSPYDAPHICGRFFLLAAHIAAVDVSPPTTRCSLLRTTISVKRDDDRIESHKGVTVRSPFADVSATDWLTIHNGQTTGQKHRKEQSKQLQDHSRQQRPVPSPPISRSRDLDSATATYFPDASTDGIEDRDLLHYETQDISAITATNVHSVGDGVQNMTPLSHHKGHLRSAATGTPQAIPLECTAHHCAACLTPEACPPVNKATGVDPKPIQTSGKPLPVLGGFPESVSPETTSNMAHFAENDSVYLAQYAFEFDPHDFSSPREEPASAQSQNASLGTTFQGRSFFAHPPGIKTPNNRTILHPTAAQKPTQSSASAPKHHGNSVLPCNTTPGERTPTSPALSRNAFTSSERGQRAPKEHHQSHQHRQYHSWMTPPEDPPSKDLSPDSSVVTGSGALGVTEAMKSPAVVFSTLSVTDTASRLNYGQPPVEHQERTGTKRGPGEALSQSLYNKQLTRQSQAHEYGADARYGNPHHKHYHHDGHTSKRYGPVTAIPTTVKKIKTTHHRHHQHNPHHQTQQEPWITSKEGQNYRARKSAVQPAKLSFPPAPHPPKRTAVTAVETDRDTKSAQVVEQSAADSSSKAETLITQMEQLYSFGVTVGILPEDDHLVSSLERMKARFRSLRANQQPQLQSTNGISAGDAPSLSSSSLSRSSSYSEEEEEEEEEEAEEGQGFQVPTGPHLPRPVATWREVNINHKSTEKQLSRELENHGLATAPELEMDMDDFLVDVNVDMDVGVTHPDHESYFYGDLCCG